MTRAALALCLALVLAIAPGSGASASEAVTAARTLPAGTILSHSDFAPEAFDNPASEALVGMETKVTIYQGKPIVLAQLGAPTLVSRNQLITLVFVAKSFRIETEGRALGAGRLGETIRVMNLSSRTTLSGQVAADGSVIIQQK